MQLLGNRRQVSSHAYHTLLKLSITEVREEAQAPSGEGLARAVRDTEELLERAKGVLPGDSHILEAEAQLSEFLDKNDQALDALAEAFETNVQSPYVAIRLADTLARRGRTPEGVVVLERCLAHNPHDGTLHYRLARLLMGRKHDVSADVEYHLRHSFTMGDSQWQRQFWYARAAFLLGKTEQALKVFGDLRDADIPYAEKVAERGRFRSKSGTNRFAGRVERLLPRCAFVVRDGDQADIFLHVASCREDVWDRLRSGTRVTFELAFNCRGAIGVDVALEG